MSNFTPPHQFNTTGQQNISNSNNFVSLPPYNQNIPSVFGVPPKPNVQKSTYGSLTPPFQSNTTSNLPGILHNQQQQIVPPPGINISSAFPSLPPPPPPSSSVPSISQQFLPPPQKQPTITGNFFLPHSLQPNQPLQSSPNPVLLPPPIPQQSTLLAQKSTTSLVVPPPINPLTKTQHLQSPLSPPLSGNINSFVQPPTPLQQPSFPQQSLGNTIPTPSTVLPLQQKSLFPSFQQQPTLATQLPGNVPLPPIPLQSQPLPEISSPSVSLASNINQYPSSSLSYQHTTPITNVSQSNNFDNSAQTSQKKPWKIDPSQMPNPNLSTNMVIYRTKDNTSYGPPPAYSNFQTQDNGNCSPRFIRSCFNQIPASKDILKTTNIPFAALIQPLANLRNGEEPIPCVDFGEGGPIRCRTCRTYINHFVQFASNGNNWVCNLCKTTNEVPLDYFCPLDSSNKRRDMCQRPELLKGTIDFFVGNEYCERQIEPPNFVFIVDISPKAIDSGLMQATLDAVRDAMKTLATDDRVHAGIVTFNSKVHFYSVNDPFSHTTSQPNRIHSEAQKNQMNFKTSEETDLPISLTIVGDTLDPFIPLPSSAWLLPVQKHIHTLEKILDLIPTLLSTALETADQSVATAALRCVIDGLEPLGGQVILFCSGPPTQGFGTLLDREVKRNYSSVQEKEMYTSAYYSKQKQHHDIGEVYRQFGQECARSQICINCIAYPPELQYFDIATFGDLTQLTGGQLYYYPLSFDTQKTSKLTLIGDIIVNQVLEIVSRETVFDAVIKVRCSQGFTCTKIEGFGLDEGFPSELRIPLIHNNSTFLCKFAHKGEKLKDGDTAYLQVAILCTRFDGRRMVRTHNLRLPVTSIINTLFKFSDLDAVVSSIVRDCVTDAQNEYPIAVRERLIGKIVDILFNYRTSCASNAPTGQLILPESLKLLPMYCLGIFKHPAFRINDKDSARPGGIPDPRADLRAFLLMCFMNLPMDIVSVWLYPRLYAVHEFNQNICTEDYEGNFILPKPKRPTSEHLSLNGIFLIDDGMDLMLYIGSETSEDLLQEYFGVSLVNESSQLSLSEGNERVEQLMKLITYLRKHRPYFCPLKIIYADRNAISIRNPIVTNFLNRLVLDRTKHDMSYDDFLYTLHRHIQNKLL